MTDVQIPRFGELLAPFISQVPAEVKPRFLALLERGAAERYRGWAAALPQHAELLMRCAASEDEIADRIESVFGVPESLVEALHAPLPEATKTYYGVFDGMDVWDQLRVQANAERQGAQAWRTISAAISDERVLEQLTACSALEESAADALDELIATHAP
jgi:hypothetical protein